jgi:hypothetical protein
VVLAEIAFQPNCYIVIAGVIAYVMVFSARELISSICCARLVFQQYIVLLSFREVSCDSWTDFPRVPVVVKVGVICVDEDRYACPFE